MEAAKLVYQTLNARFAAVAVFQRRSPISRSARLKPKIDQNDLQGLSEFLYLHKNPMKLRKTKATRYSWEHFMASLSRSIQIILQNLRYTLR